MKISKVKSKPTLYFANLNIGDLFKREGEVCMKMEEIDTATTHVNAVSLERGTVIKMYGDEMVEPIYEDDYIFEIDCD